jgi:hypothetical protein
MGLVRLSRDSKHNRFALLVNENLQDFSRQFWERTRVLGFGTLAVASFTAVCAPLVTRQASVNQSFGVTNGVAGVIRSTSKSEKTLCQHETHNQPPNYSLDHLRFNRTRWRCEGQSCDDDRPGG